MLQLARHRVAVHHLARAAPCRLISSAVVPRRLPTSTPSWKEPARGGQNLTKRYERLEKSLRGKELYQQEIGDLVEEADPVRSVAAARKHRNTVKTFMGFVVPQEPKPPGPDGACLSHMMGMRRCDPLHPLPPECCMSGCAVCVQDLYVEALEEYTNALASLRKSLALLNVPEERWPPEIRTGRNIPAPKKDVALSAFAELERQLLERKKTDAHSTGSLTSGSHRATL